MFFGIKVMIEFFLIPYIHILAYFLPKNRMALEIFHENRMKNFFLKVYHFFLKKIAKKMGKCGFSSIWLF